MAPICRTCSRINPPAASFCYYDGVSLDTAHHVAPVAPGAKLFPTPFVFPSGRHCRNFDELVLTLNREWPEAKTLLKEGIFESFLGSLGRADLVMAARLGAREADGDRGLDQFLAKLPVTDREGARINVQPAEINLGVLTGDHSFLLKIKNDGAGLLTGAVSSDDAHWLTFGNAPGTPQKLFQSRVGADIPVHIVYKNLRASPKLIEGRILIESNGGAVVVTVRAEKPLRPFPGGVFAGAMLPREIAAKAKANPREAAPLFETGAVQAWYESNGWTYPVQGPASTGLAAIQQFFEALGLVPAPVVTISTSKLRFQGKPGESSEQVIQVVTEERRPVFAHGVSTTPWLHVGQAVLEGRSASIPVRVAIPATPGERLKGAIQVAANGQQRFTVEVELEILGKPIASRGTDRAPIKPPPVMAAVTAAVAATTVAEVIPARPPAVLRPVDVRPIPSVPDVVAVRTTPRDNGVPVVPSGPPRRNWAVLHAIPVLLLIGLVSATFARDGVVWVLRATTPPPAPVLVETEEPPGPDYQRVDVAFHDKEIPITLGTTGAKPTETVKEVGRPAAWDASMRFGVVLSADEKGVKLTTPKRLTRDPRGTTNNTVVRLDGKEWIFGELPWRLKDGTSLGLWDGGGRWRVRERPMGNDKAGKPRVGRESVWLYPKQEVTVTQTVEIVHNPQSGMHDTVLVRYALANQGKDPHKIGLRFLLDTFIGSNDGVPFLIPGQDKLCTTSMDFNDPKTMPDFIQARENQELSNPGTIAQVQLKVGGGLDAPDRVTLGGWPNFSLRKRFPGSLQEKTMWNVPLLPIDVIPPGDSAVVLYWNEQEVPPGGTRQVGFAYGLGQMSSGQGKGKLAVTVGGFFVPEGEFTVTAYLSNPTPEQTVTLSLPDGFTILDGPARRSVPKPAATTNVSPVTWKVQGARKPGSYRLTVESSNGAKQSQSVRIQARSIFGSN